MQENHSRAGKDVERLTISDDPHERYQEFDPWTGEKITPGIPILTRAKYGKIISKDVIYSTVKCPECNVSAEYSHQSEPICPKCGMVCVGDDVLLSEQMVRDAKAAGRLKGT